MVMIRVVPRVLEAAQRVVEAHDLKKKRAESAEREWEHVPTLSNAIRRDDTKAEAEVLVDAYIVAEAVIKAAEG